MNRIKINGIEYPCRMTMGAMVEFKRETGREISDLEGGGISDVVTFLWCCIRSACRADGVEFTLSALDMADRMDPNDFAKFQSVAFTTETAAKTQAGKKKA